VGSKRQRGPAPGLQRVRARARRATAAPDSAAAMVARAAAAASAIFNESSGEEEEEQEEVEGVEEAEVEDGFGLDDDDDDDDDDDYASGRYRAGAAGGGCLARRRRYRSRLTSDAPARNLMSRFESVSPAASGAGGACPSPPRNQVRSRVAAPTSPPPAPRRPVRRAVRMVEIDNRKVFEVRKVLEVSYNSSGTPTHFLISWEGYSRSKDSWVSARELMVPVDLFCEQHGFPASLPFGPQGAVRVHSAGARAVAADEE